MPKDRGGTVPWVTNRATMEKAVTAAARVGHKIDLKLRAYMLLKGAELPKIYDAIEYDQSGKVVCEQTIVEEV